MTSLHELEIRLNLVEAELQRERQALRDERAARAELATKFQTYIEKENEKELRNYRTGVTVFGGVVLGLVGFIVYEVAWPAIKSMMAKGGK